MVPDWDEYFLEICEVVSHRSKDPSTKIGVVIVGPDKNIISSGYNGFPSSVIESALRWERPLKYSYVEHGERNAIYSAARHGIELRGATLYATGLGVCHECARAIIQSGIKKVVVRGKVAEAWYDSVQLGLNIMQEAQVVVDYSYWEIHDKKEETYIGSRYADGITAT